MTPRMPVPDGLLPACELAIPSGAKSATVQGKRIALPHANPSKVVVFGDTGCRIKGERIQECNDPSKWPLESIATRAASEKPGLVVHVGDYLYREDKCPQDQSAFCGTGPAGDNWPTWNADFFAPAAKLLAAAPWAFSRGNHEDCTRAWRGWFYYLDPRPWAGGACEAYSAPYLVKLGKFELFMLDSSALKAKQDDKQVAEFARQLKALKPQNAWLVDHHPFWEAKADSSNSLSLAWERAEISGVNLVVSGHTHFFELLAYDHNRPPQLIAGDGGTKLTDPKPKPTRGQEVSGATVLAGTAEYKFGHVLLTKSKAGWNLTLNAPHHGTIATCSLWGRTVACGGLTGRPAD